MKNPRLRQARALNVRVSPRLSIKKQFAARTPRARRFTARGIFVSAAFGSTEVVVLEELLELKVMLTKM